jgi:hypothetical protein
VGATFHEGGERIVPGVADLGIEDACDLLGRGLLGHPSTHAAMMHPAHVTS